MYGYLLRTRRARALVDLVVKRQAGHSKWANIKHTKTLKDSQKAALFTKLGRQMRVAVQEGGSSDPTKNLKLDQVVQQARRLNMPVASIQSVIRSTETDKSKCKGHLIEIKGPGSCFILCEVFTDNLHHLKQVLVSILRKHQSKFSDGGGKHVFEQKGIIEAEPHDSAKGKQEDVLELATEHAIDSGAEDVKLLDADVLQFTCSHTAFGSVQTKLEKLDYKITSASVDFVPCKLQVLSDDDLETCSSLYEKLENHPDVVKLYDNIA